MGSDTDTGSNSRRWIGVALAAAGIVGIILGSRGAAERYVEPYVPKSEKMAAVYKSVSKAAQGRRFLVVRRTGEPRGEVFATALTADGWRPFAAAPAESADFSAALDKVAVRAAEDYLADEAFDEDTLRALRAFYVRFVVMEDAGNPAPIVVGERDPWLRWMADVYAAEVRSAQPVYQLVSEPELAATDSRAAGDPLLWARKRVTNDVYPEEQRLDGPVWSYDFELEVPQAATYLIAWPSTGARLTVDGAPVVPRSANVPMIAIDLAAGRRVVSLRYGEPNPAEWVVIAGALGLFVGLGLFVISFRPPRADAGVGAGVAADTDGSAGGDA